MAVLDISEFILGNRNRLPEIVNWLTEHVGPLYGRGDDPVVHIGSGWEIIAVREVDPDENYIIGWSVDITNPELSTLFALTFCGSAI